MKKIHNYDNKTKKDNKLFHLNKDVVWIIEITLLAFTLSFVLSMFSDKVVSGSTAIVSVIVLLVFIFFGIIFDMIGVATLTSKESSFHAMSSKKINGAKESISLLRNSNIVSSICNDVVGDICGIVSGSLGASLTTYLVITFHTNILWITILITSLISALTVGGKALGKQLAMKKSDKIVFGVGKIKHLLHLK